MAISGREFLSEEYEPDYPDSWPPEEYLLFENGITEEQVTGLQNRVESRTKETEIDSFLRNNRALLTAPLHWYSTGHHGAWVLSQQMLRPRLSTVKPGLIPDYIIGGRSSGGFHWWVVELKGPDQSLFSGGKSDIRFSSHLNRAICQTIKYIDYCDEIQSYIRDQMDLSDFRKPRGLILIGVEEELNSMRDRQKLRKSVNQVLGEHLSIRTYSSLVKIARRLKI